MPPRGRLPYRFNRIQWERRLRLRRAAPLLGWGAAVLLLLALGGARLAARPAPPMNPTSLGAPTIDLQALVIAAAVESAERAGQVQPALPSALLYATPTLTPTPQPTPSPTATATPTPTPTPAFVISEARLPVVDWERVSYLTAPAARAAAAFLEPMTQVYQGLDPNEAPSIAAMVLSFYGMEAETTLPAAQRDLPLDAESGVALPGVLVEHLRGYRLEALVYEGMSLDQLQRLISNGVPVIVAQRLTPDDPTPHYRVVRGYSDRRGVMLANDPEFAASLSFSYAEFSQMWEDFDGFAIPVFLARQTGVVRAILGEEGDKTADYVEKGRRLGEPPEEPTPTDVPATAEATGRSPLAPGVPAAGRLVGSGGGAYVIYHVVAATRQTLNLDLTYTPDDPIIARAVGLRVYGPGGRVVGEAVNVTGRVGERRVSFGGEAGTMYAVQVYNYLSGVTLDYSLSLVGPTVTPTPTFTPDAEAGSDRVEAPPTATTPDADGAPTLLPTPPADTATPEAVTLSPTPEAVTVSATPPAPLGEETPTPPAP